MKENLFNFEPVAHSYIEEVVDLNKKIFSEFTGEEINIFEDFESFKAKNKGADLKI